MTIAFMRFPEGKAKALTLSYDDGVEQDIKLMEILDKHGLKCTFNINSGIFAPEGKVYPEGTIHRRMTKDQVIKTFKNSPHEVAIHSATHPFLDKIPPAVATKDIIDDKVALEEIFEQPIRGMAYPMGAYNDTVADILANAGVLYARTTKQTESFAIPTDWLRLPSTCRHLNPRLMELAKKFVEDTVKNAPTMFYLWGHSYEFEADDNWNVIEEFAEYVSGKDDIWYATNIEIFEYIEAYNRLIYSADLSMIRNPSAIPVWIRAGKHGTAPATYKIEAGQTIKL